MLALFEDTRARLGERFPAVPEDEVAVVLHGTLAQLLLGGSVVDLLAREEGESAVVSLLLGAGRGAGPGDALVGAFAGRALRHTEGTWRAHLARIATSAADSDAHGGGA